MRDPKLSDRGGRLQSAVLWGSLWMLASLFVVVLLWPTDLAAGLFQSGMPTEATGLFQSGLPTPSEAVAPTSTSLSALDTATAPVFAGPSATAPVTATVTPTATQVPSPIATDTSVPAATSAPAATATAIATGPTVATPSPARSEGGRYPADEADLRFDLRMLFDSVALGMSYLWLGCGIVLLLGVISLFAALWAIGRRGRQGE